MKILDINANTPSWYALRKNKLGASESSIILDLSPYCTKFQLWGRKLGLIPEQEEHGGMIRGRILEKVAFEIYQKQELSTFRPAVIESSEYPFLIASLDGYSETLHRAFEIKCLNLEDHDKELVPFQYMPQLQQQMLVCGLNEIDYVGYHPDSVKPFYIIKVKRDDRFLADYIPKAVEFWSHVEQFKEPPKVERDYEDLSRDAEYVADEVEFSELCDMIEELEAKKEACKLRMIEISQGRNVQGSRSKLTYVNTIGRIDYKKAVTENLPEIELEPYRGKPSQSVRITRGKNE